MGRYSIQARVRIHLCTIIWFHLRMQLERYGSGVIALWIRSIKAIGTITPLRDIYEMAQEFDCVLVVDESHSLGTHGTKGAGLVEALGLTNQVDFITVSLAKTFAYQVLAQSLGRSSYRNTSPLSRTLRFLVQPYYHMRSPFRLETTLAVIKESDEKREALFKAPNRSLHSLKTDWL